MHLPASHVMLAQNIFQKDQHNPSTTTEEVDDEPLGVETVKIFISHNFRGKRTVPNLLRFCLQKQTVEQNLY